jgi:hypothetical protein
VFQPPQNGVIVTKDGDGNIIKVEPEFPDKVIGDWTCRGWFIGDGAHTETGAWVSTTQMDNFGAEPGKLTLITDGVEIADIGAGIERAVTGGTGKYAMARGEAVQELLGFNESDGVNLSFRIAVRLR